jgi:DNA-binding transcriptional ArsR family regulator
MSEHDHERLLPLLPERAQLERTASLFRALSDPGRLSMLLLLREGEACVSELASATGEAMNTVSQRLGLLEKDALVKKRREGRHVYYALADEHVLCIVEDGLVHAGEPSEGASAPRRTDG